MFPESDGLDGASALIYIIMCGGKYAYWKTPKQLIEINGERLVDRTIRLLKENGCKEIYISSNDPVFDSCGVPRLEHENGFAVDGDEITGYWLDAFYPTDQETTYIFGDVYFSEDAIKTIVNYPAEKNTLFGSKLAKNKQHQNWGEPFAYIVKDMQVFRHGINAVKHMWDIGVLDRHPIVWELYRYLNRLDMNVQQVLDSTFVVIDDETIDFDDPSCAERFGVT